MYAIYREDALTNQISLMTKPYSTYAEAAFHLQETSLEYLRQKTKDDSKLIVQSVPMATDLMAPSVEPGMYLKLSTEQVSRYNAYHKSYKVVPGYLWNGQTFQVNLIQWFGILELQPSAMTEDEIASHYQKCTSQKLQQHGEQVRVIEELKEVLARRKNKTVNEDFLDNFDNSFRNASPSEFAQELAKYVAMKRGH